MCFLEKTTVPHVTDTLFPHNVVSSYTLPRVGLELTTLVVVICTDFTGSCKSNNNTITTTTGPRSLEDAQKFI